MCDQKHIYSSLALSSLTHKMLLLPEQNPAEPPYLKKAFPTRLRDPASGRGGDFTQPRKKFFEGICPNKVFHNILSKPRRSKNNFPHCPAYLREARLEQSEELAPVEVVLRGVCGPVREPHARRPDVLAAVQGLQVVNLVPSFRRMIVIFSGQKLPGGPIE